MQQYIFELLAIEGVFCVLFSCLLFYVLKESNKREIKYQKFIFKISAISIGIEDYDKKKLKNL